MCRACRPVERRVIAEADYKDRRGGDYGDANASVAQNTSCDDCDEHQYTEVEALKVRSALVAIEPPAPIIRAQKRISAEEVRLQQFGETRGRHAPRRYHLERHTARTAGLADEAECREHLYRSE